MPRSAINRAGEMEAFVRVVEGGSFSAAARALGMTPSAVSKLIGRLEGRLGVRLLHRSTRNLQLTVEGRQFHERSVRLLADLEAAERGAAAGREPRGRVSVNTSISFGTQMLIPLVPRFLEQFPRISLDIVLSDRVVNLIDERADIAIRWGPLPSSGLVARRLGEASLVIVASPEYLRRQGTPYRPEDLGEHEKLDFNYRRRIPDWPLRVGNRTIDMPVQARVRASDGEALRHLALAGVGMARLSRYHVQADLDAGRLTALLEPFNPLDTQPIHAVYLGKGEQLPARVRVVLDFLVANIGEDPRIARPRRRAQPPSKRRRTVDGG